MFNELTQQNIINAINSLKGTPHLPIQNPKNFSIWFNGKLYPSKAIINRHYELINETNLHPQFNTDDAQDKLLDLGFPIVEKNFTDNDSFFSERDLISFSKLVRREKYDHNNIVDINIGQYLNKISWQKTAYWASLLEDHKFKRIGRRQWNTQHKTLKQVYKNYTWYKLVPRDSKNKNVFFTVGMHNNKVLVYKMDIQRDSPYFDKDKEYFFDNRLKELGINSQFVSINELKSYSWVTLIEKSKSFLYDNLKHYHNLVKELDSIRPLKAARICWNTKNWEEPSGRDGKSSNESFEAAAGFAHDEWLFDLNSEINGFCYGRIEPINKSRNVLKEKHIDLLLFTFCQDTSTLKWIGKISNVKIINEIESIEISNTSEGISWFNKRLNQLKKIGNIDHNYYTNTSKEDLYNMKFKIENVEIFENKIKVASHLFKIKRYVLNHLSRVDEHLIFNELKKSNFEPSTKKPPLSPSKKIKKTYKSEVVEYDNLHRDIQIGLIDFLERTFPKNNISYEDSSEINNRLIDVVMQEGERKYYFEVKSYPNIMTCIRMALGQLIEYCFYTKEKRADKLIIVSQNKSNSDVEDFLLHLRQTLDLNVYYYQFDRIKKELSNFMCEE